MLSSEYSSFIFTPTLTLATLACSSVNRQTPIIGVNGSDVSDVTTLTVYHVKRHSIHLGLGLGSARSLWG